MTFQKRQSNTKKTFEQKTPISQTGHHFLLLQKVNDNFHLLLSSSSYLLTYKTKMLWSFTESWWLHTMTFREVISLRKTHNHLILYFDHLLFIFISLCILIGKVCAVLMIRVGLAGPALRVNLLVTIGLERSWSLSSNFHPTIRSAQIKIRQWIIRQHIQLNLFSFLSWRLKFSFNQKSI